jgi:hypothetical protein
MSSSLKTFLFICSPFALLYAWLSPPLSSWNGIQLRQNSIQLRQEVNKFVSVDMPLKQAQKIIEDSNFECEDNKNSSFVVENRDKNEHHTKQDSVDGDFLSCSREKSYFIASTSWNILLLYKQGKVKMVYSVVNPQNL